MAVPAFLLRRMISFGSTFSSRLELDLERALMRPRAAADAAEDELVDGEANAGAADASLRFLRFVGPMATTFV